MAKNFTGNIHRGRRCH